jgi:hypothetical protein
MPDDDINARMHYFDRQFLRASDFQVEQKYHLERHRLHNRLLHTPGVAALNDLIVSGDFGQDTLTVAKGIAIDAEGREIVLLKEENYAIDPLTIPGKYELIVRLDEVPSDPSTDPGVNGSTRIREKPIFELLTPNTAKPSMLRLAEIEVQPAGKLKSSPTSIRTFAGTLVGASTTFETVTANNFTLKGSGVDPAKRPDLSCSASGDIRFRTTRPAKSSPEETLLITSTGFVKSPMWNVTELYVNQRATSFPTPPNNIICTPKKFITGGGILLIFASGSGQASGTELTVGMDLLVGDKREDGTISEIKVGSVLGCVNDTTEAHKPFMTSSLVVRNIASGEHTLTLKTTISTKVVQNDFFNVTILELPFQ